jgi:tol-pal system protein YbgF
MMRPRSLGAVLLLVLLAGCATKRDLRDLRTEVEALRSSQDAMLREIQRQNAMLMDSLSSQGTRMRGDMNNRLNAVERQLVQIQELTGQGQAQLAQMREQIRAREAAAAAGAFGGPTAAGSPDELFNTSLATLRRGSLATARSGFEEFLRTFPQHALAADAQFHIGETYQEAKDLPRALEAYARVLELYPASTTAPTALYRAGLIEVERGNRDRARTMFTQVTSAYPRSAEAPLAKEQLSKLGRR